MCNNGEVSWHNGDVWTKVSARGVGLCVSTCEDPKKNIENYELISILALGIRSNLYEQFSIKRFEAASANNEKINNDNKLKKLYELRQSYKEVNRTKKSLKWYQSTSKYDAMLNNIEFEAFDLVEDEALYSWMTNDIDDVIREYRSKLENKSYIHDDIPSLETITAVLLLTPNFKEKSFKELVELVNEQTRSNTSN